MLLPMPLTVPLKTLKTMLVKYKYWLYGRCCNWKLTLKTMLVKYKYIKTGVNKIVDYTLKTMLVKYK